MFICSTEINGNTTIKKIIVIRIFSRYDALKNEY